MIAVVHLVWGPLGCGPLREFLASYRRHPAGVDHELVVLFNGVTDQQRPELLAELDGVEYRLLELKEPVQDLAAYIQVAEHLERERLCFLNSYSAILGASWLAKLDQALDQSQVGLAGATGSWASLRSLAMLMHFLPSAYRGVMPGRRAVIDQFQSIERDSAGAAPEAERAGAGVPSPATERDRPSLTRASLTTLAALPATCEQLLRFEGFPDHHLRTNAFVVERKVFAALRTGGLRRKIDAYALESGRRSITRQVESMGLYALVVDREGDLYEQRGWPGSRTLWQGGQERLLVADNQTRMYANGGLDRRRMLSAMAWGSRADPRSASHEAPVMDELPCALEQRFGSPER